MDHRLTRSVILARLADALTLTRVLAAGLLVWLGITRGANALSSAAAVTILAWTSDALDGLAARAAGVPTRLGRLDFAIDSVFYTGIVAYIALAGFVSPVAALAFVLVAATCWVLSRRKAVALIFLRIVDLAGVVLAFRYARWLGWLVTVWLIVLVVVYRRRLIERAPRRAKEVLSMLRRAGRRRSS